MPASSSADPTSTLDTPALIEDIGRRARTASRRMRRLTPEDRRRMLLAMADGVEAAADAIRAANQKDVEAASGNLSAAMIDRLTLTDERITAMVQGLREVAELPDRLGEEIDRYDHPRGFPIRKVRVALGVIAVIYESRPNVTADAAGLCFKAGSAVILKGGREALASNTAILDAMRDAGAKAGMPDDVLQLIPITDRAAVGALVKQDEHVDLVIPRGGEGLIRAVAENATVPVLKHYKGVCHVVVDRAADIDMALDIVENAKVQRPGVCNAAETVVVHEAVANEFLPKMAERLAAHGVELRADGAARAHLPNATPATDDDWAEEYLDLILAVRVVDSLDAAIDHVETWGSHHSDAIVTSDADRAARFCEGVDSATVYVNASTRFTDGSEFGMGAEIGISTDKLHARGPCGVDELTTYKYVIDGTGDVR